MTNPRENQLKDLLMNDMINYIREKWTWSKGIKIQEDKTFSDNITPTFYEKKEGNVDPVRSQVPHTYGVLWTVKDVEFDIGELVTSESNVSIFSKTFVNSTDETLTVNESLEHSISVSDEFQFGFTEKISAGYESKISCEVGVKGLGSASAGLTFNANVELGATQTKTKKVVKVTTTGASFDISVPPMSKRTVEIIATRSNGYIKKKALFVPKGKAYANVASNSNEDIKKAHTYIFELDDIGFEYPIEYMVEADVYMDFRIHISSDTEAIYEAKLNI
ncbi:hypothetical protein RJ45_12850 [Photobacterium gaetbulicola]|uniref:Uncharacterized protein n=1 Tax=Photobacterium gaetbulicola TaxID=1295392 RepID=A0A0B9GEW8_9GAMM|nr:hypothetical protein [Photobacterium gaetbulicola]KHT63285.1 hypothetical protein RJ45_12850 [Photobacterium gaetbulicola]